MYLNHMSIMREITEKDWAKKDELQSRLDKLLVEATEAKLVLYFHVGLKRSAFMMSYLSETMKNNTAGASFGFKGICDFTPLPFRFDFDSSDGALSYGSSPRPADELAIKKRIYAQE
jgi:hypothetical protein